MGVTGEVLILFIKVSCGGTARRRPQMATARRRDMIPCPPDEVCYNHTGFLHVGVSFHREPGYEKARRDPHFIAEFSQFKTGKARAVVWDDQKTLSNFKAQSQSKRNHKHFSSPGIHRNVKEGRWFFRSLSRVSVQFGIQFTNSKRIYWAPTTGQMLLHGETKGKHASNTVAFHRTSRGTGDHLTLTTNGTQHTRSQGGAESKRHLGHL